MKELLNDLDRWRRQDKQIALARVVDLDGSGPRLPGAAMAVSQDGEVSGSVSGGCVEGAVVSEALEVIETGERRMVTFGYSDDEAFAVGLTCGGTIHLFLEPLDWDLFPLVADTIRATEPIALATVIEGPHTGAKIVCRPKEGTLGSLGDPALDRVVERDVQGELAAGRTGIRRYGAQGQAREEDVSVFIESFAPPPRMIVFGAVDFTAALVKVAKLLGYRVSVCDARPVFATKRRFPQADEVAVEWPDRFLAERGQDLTSRDAIAVLTHDAKFDIPAITSALQTNVGYIGVMGSRRTHDDRTQRLVDAGVDADGLARLRSPIGLDLGGRTPEETAISIVAEIIALRTGREVPALRDTDGPIHRA